MRNVGKSSKRRKRKLNQARLILCNILINM
jgi:hypothetical protein